MLERQRDIIDCADPYEYEGAGFIACLDSGIGGISVLAAARKLLPEEDFIYFADIANAPYGDKDKETVHKAVLDQVNKLLTWKLKALLLACNTATAATVTELRNLLDIPILGVEPALKPAVKECMGCIVVLGTALTLKEKKFADLLSKMSTAKDIVTLSCPGLMELVEAGPDHPQVGQYLEKLLAPYKKTMDGIVLGCTHYLFLKPWIQKLFPDVNIFDGNQGVANRLQKVMEEENLLGGGTGQLLFLSSLTDEEDQELFVKKYWDLYDYYQTIMD
jgi:glutamate racemase